MNEMIQFLRQMPAVNNGAQYSKPKKAKNFANIVVEVLIGQNAAIPR